MSKFETVLNKYGNKTIIIRKLQMSINGKKNCAYELSIFLPKG